MVTQWWWSWPPWRNGNLHSLPVVVRTDQQRKERKNKHNVEMRRALVRFPSPSLCCTSHTTAFTLKRPLNLLRQLHPAVEWQLTDQHKDMLNIYYIIYHICIYPTEIHQYLCVSFVYSKVATKYVSASAQLEHKQGFEWKRYKSECSIKTLCSQTERLLFIYRL